MIKRKVINGYSVVEICYDRALRDMPYAQCGVNVYKDGRIDFISYTTRVITIDADGWLEITGTRSEEHTSELQSRPALSPLTQMDGSKLREPIRRLHGNRSVAFCGNTFLISVIKM